MNIILVLPYPLPIQYFEYNSSWQIWGNILILPCPWVWTRCLVPLLPPTKVWKKVVDAQHNYIILIDVNWCSPGRGWYCILHKYRWSCDFYLQNLLLLLSLDKNIGHGPSIVTNFLGYYHHLYSCCVPHKIHWNIFLSGHLII